MNFFCHSDERAQNDRKQLNRPVGKNKAHSADKRGQKAKISDDAEDNGDDGTQAQLAAAQTHGKPESRPRADQPKQPVKNRRDGPQRKPPAHNPHTVIHKAQPRAQQHGERKLKNLTRQRHFHISRKDGTTARRSAPRPHTQGCLPAPRQTAPRPPD